MIKKWITNLFFITVVILVLNAIFISFSYNSISEHASEPLEKKTGSVDRFFDEKIRLLMFAGYIPSLSACIIHSDTVVWSKGYGFYDFRGLKQPSMDTIYQVASVSKTVTATAILQLYEKGVFDLDDDVNLYLPFSLRNPNYPDDPISFRMLLCHHASLHDHDEAAAYEYFAGDYPLSFVGELLVPGGEAYHADFWGKYPPGGGGNYSNIGFTVLGFLVELLSGQTFEEYCQQNIFMPLRMENTSFEMEGLPPENIACSYIRFSRIYIKIPHMDYTFLDPCGGLLTTPDDLSRFLIVHMNNGMYQGVRILDEVVIQEMHRVQYPDSEPYFGTLRFGLGWLVFEEEFGRKTHGHDGDLTFSHARMRILSDNASGIIYFFNKGVRPSIGPRALSSLMEYGSDAFIRKMLYDKANEKVFGQLITH